MLDQRIAGQRAGDIDARRRRFEGGRQLGEGEPVGAGKFDAAAFDKAARRCRTDAGDNPVAARPHFAIAGFNRNEAGFHRSGVGFGHDADAPRIARRHQRLDVGILGGGEIGCAVDQRDRVILRRICAQAERIFDPGIAAADHKYMFVGIFGGIVELILNMGQVAARAAHQVGVALGAERHDHGFGHDLFAAHQRQAIGRGVALQFGRAGRAIAVAADDRHHRSGDGRAGADDAFHFGAMLDVHAGGGRLLIPGAQNNLALAGFEIQR